MKTHIYSTSKCLYTIIVSVACSSVKRIKLHDFAIFSILANSDIHRQYQTEQHMQTYNITDVLYIYANRSGLHHVWVEFLEQRPHMVTHHIVTFVTHCIWGACTCPNKNDESLFRALAAEMHVHQARNVQWLSYKQYTLRWKKEMINNINFLHQIWFPVEWMTLAPI